MCRDSIGRSVNAPCHGATGRFCPSATCRCIERAVHRGKRSGSNRTLRRRRSCCHDGMLSAPFLLLTRLRNVALRVILLTSRHRGTNFAARNGDIYDRQLRVRSFRDIDVANGVKGPCCSNCWQTNCLLTNYLLAYSVWFSSSSYD